MNMRIFKEGRGVHFEVGCREIYGVVMQVYDECVSIVQVLPKSKRDSRCVCYNEPGAEYSRHRDNVKLRDCPPPFSELYSKSPNGAFAYANMEKPHVLSKQKCEEYDVQIVDDGFLLTDDMMLELRDHPWDSLHKEKSGLSGRIRGDGSRPLPTVSDSISSPTNDYEL